MLTYGDQGWVGKKIMISFDEIEEDIGMVIKLVAINFNLILHDLVVNEHA